MNLLERIIVPAWAQALLKAAPFIVLGLLIAAVVVQRTTIVRVTGERDRIIRVFDPTGKTSPDKAIVAAQLVVTQRDAAKNALTVTERNYRLATANAQVADLNHARAVEQRDAAINGKVQNDLQDQLASARADADAHARSLWARDAATAAPGTDRSRLSTASVPGPADAASHAPDARAATDLDDTRVCAANTVLAEGWVAWWLAIEASRASVENQSAH